MTFSFQLFQVGRYFSVMAKGEYCYCGRLSGGLLYIRFFISGVIQGLSVICRFTVLGGKIRSIAWASCDVKEDVRSSTVASGAASSNHLRAEAHLPRNLY